MVCKESVTIWFRGLHPDERVDLMCSLLDTCNPLELRFLGTYIEFAASKHHGNLQKYEKTANDCTFGELRDLYDDVIRRKFCIYLALLYSYNKKAATDLFKFLENFELDNEKLNSKEEHLSVNSVSCSEDETSSEIKLLLSMASYHPAFTFHQKQILRSKLRSPAKRAPASVQNKEPMTEPIKRSPQIPSNMNDLVHIRNDISSMSLSSSTPSAARLASPIENRVPNRYQAVPFTPLFTQTPTIPGAQFQSIPVCNIGSVHAIPAPITVYPTNPHTQVPPNLQPMLVKPSSVGKTGGIAQGVNGANGVIHTIYPAPIFAANRLPTSSSVATCTPTEYRFASAPIPVRSTRVYGPVNQPGFHPLPQQQHMSFNYQSPMDSPLTSPFTSPSPSPKSSPLPSPRLSSFPSPVESPMSRKKFGGDRLSGRRNSDQFASVYDWLRSLRLHKYSDTFKDYTFEQMKVLTDEDLAMLGLTQGARKKFKLHINALIEKGFRGFGIHTGAHSDSGRPGSTSSSVDMPPYRKTSNSSDSRMTPVSLVGETKRTSVSMDVTSSKDTSCDTQFSHAVSISTIKGPSLERNFQEKHHETNEVAKADMAGFLNRRGDEHFIEKSSDEGSQGTSESMEDFLSDDEVFMTRRPTVIENKDCQFVLASCYNCGSKDHFGEQCVEQTMEGETYQRYGYRLKYDDERLKDER